MKRYAIVFDLWLIQEAAQMSSHFILVWNMQCVVFTPTDQDISPDTNRKRQEKLVIPKPLDKTKYETQKRNN